MARTAIERAGIAVTLTNVGLVVAAEDADRALKVLEAIWPDEPAQNEPEIIEVWKCAECGSTDVVRIRRLPIFIIITTLLLVAGHVVGQIEPFALLIAIIAALFFFGPNRRCASCGELWRSWATSPAPPDVPVESPAVPCPRCGSPETYRLNRRRQKAWTLLVNFTLPPLLLLWPFLPRRKCEECGHEFR